MKKNKGTAEELRVVSFKLANDIYKRLENYASTQKDEAGRPLSPAQAARRLMTIGLEQTKKK